MGFLRHGMWALLLFVASALAMEALIPGSVMPYVDPVPFAILACIACSIDAVTRNVRAHSRVRLLFGLFLIMLMIGSLFMNVFGCGRLHMVVVLLMCVMIAFVAWIMHGDEEKQQYHARG